MSRVSARSDLSIQKAPEIPVPSKDPSDYHSAVTGPLADTARAEP
jgi:hypothetical protein